MVELEQLTDGPVKLGTIARQVRIDQGRRTETKFKIIRYERSKRLGFAGVNDPFRWLRTEEIESGKVVPADLYF